MMKERYESGTHNAIAGVPRRTGSLSPVRRRDEADSFRSTLHACAPRTRVQKEITSESESKRTKAKGQGARLKIERDPHHRYYDRLLHLLSGARCNIPSQRNGIAVHEHHGRIADPSDAVFHARSRVLRFEHHDAKAINFQPFSLGPRFPRHGLVDGFRFSHLAGKFRIGQALADDLPNADIKALGISHLAIVEPECLFVDIAKQVEGFHADVGSVQAALQETPEILHTIGVNVAVHILDRVIDNGVLVVGFQPIVGFQFVAEDRRARFDALTDQRLKVFFLARVHVTGNDLPASLC
jgi:hypothetical protein